MDDIFGELARAWDKVTYLSLALIVSAWTLGVFGLSILLEDCGESAEHARGRVDDRIISTGVWSQSESAATRRRSVPKSATTRPSLIITGAQAGDAARGAQVPHRLRRATAHVNGAA